MLEPARLLNPAAGCDAIGKNDPAGYNHDRDNYRSTEAKQQGHMEHARQQRQEIEQAEDQKSAESGERRPASRPHALPQQRRMGEAEPHREPIVSG
jgi:hypothetical protein